MQETVFLELNKKSKLNWKTPFKGVECKLSIISLIMFLGILIVLTMIYLTLKRDWTLYSGLFFGYLFSLIGFLIICFSGWLLSISLNKYFFILLYLVRLVIYAIPIVIYAENTSFFSIYTIIIGISLCPFSSLFANVKFPIHKHRKEDKNGD
ncbi:MG406 family protein [Spiroplasma endosymbiont of Polydrusus formosus]|uniref:MG406 family protein n=1 Tax=Spiroplasma endosymbiont of Polydrusus formosus TaxID=3139326 RepID=UPI0035B533E6